MSSFKNEIGFPTCLNLTNSAYILFAGILLAITISLYFAPPAAFFIDDVLYTDMARAMAENGSLHVVEKGDIETAPILTKSSAGVFVNGAYGYAQYPGGYAFLAAPFYALFGINGLILMNALGAVATLWLTYRIALLFFDDEAIAGASALILGLATYFHGYAFAIWPHLSALGLVLAGVYFGLLGAQKTNQKCFLYMALAGTAFGVSLNFRIDGIFLFAALFLWLRLVALPSNRLAILVFAAGLAPHLIYAAYLNSVKFGVFLPFYYGPKEGPDSASAYTMLGYLGATLLVGSIFVDTSRPYFRRILAIVQKFWPLTLLTIGSIAFLISGEFLLRILSGAYVLVVDLQAFNGDFVQDGLIKDKYGYLSYWGYPKKALLQSLPFAALLLIPVVFFFRGWKFQYLSLALAMIATPIAFYSIKQWHGGPGYNMRYFLPCMPFIAILAAHGLTTLQRSQKTNTDILLRAIIIGAAAALGIYKYAALSYKPLSTPFELYPQLILFLILAISIALYLLGQRRFKNGIIALSVAGVSLGYAGAISLDDTFGYLAKRSVKAQMERYYAHIFPEGSLVLTIGEDFLMGASANGVVVARAKRAQEDRETMYEAVQAYADAGKCVYIHTGLAKSFFGDGHDFSFTIIPTPGLPPDPGDFTLYALNGQHAQCAIEPT